MSLPRADAALETCEKHLDETGSYGTEVEAILTAYASAVIYACLEAEARSIVAARACHPGTDPHVTNFTRIAATRLMRSVKIGELSGAAAFFHPDCKTRFNDQRDGEASNAWDTILSNRQIVAHEEEGARTVAISNLTFKELKDLYPKALTILDCFRAALAP